VIAPRARRRVRALELMLTSHPRDQRAKDNQAIDVLCLLLDRAVETPPQRLRSGLDIDALCFLDEGATLRSRSGLDGTHGELWSEILRRRLRNRYPKPQGSRVRWMHRHFHVRQRVAQETQTQSAKHVARVWMEAGVPARARTILTGATRAAASKAAIEWIRAVEDGARRQVGDSPVPDTAMVYVAIERAMARIAAEFSDGRKVKRVTAKSRRQTAVMIRVNAH
jgi:hypothetical protein